MVQDAGFFDGAPEFGLFKAGGSHPLKGSPPLDTRAVPGESFNR